MAGHTATRLEGLFTFDGIALGLRWQIAGYARLPDERGDGLDVVLVQPEGGHFGAGPPFVRVLQPRRDPLFVHLHADFLEARSDLLDFTDQIALADVGLFDLGIEPG